MGENRIGMVLANYGDLALGYLRAISKATA